MPNQFFSPEGDLENYFVTEYWLIDQYVGDELWAWGNGINGQIGNRTFTNISTPATTFTGGTNWKQVSTDRWHTAAIKSDGTLWIWGRGGQGQLGNATTVTVSTPVTTFTGGTNWKQVSCGYNHTAAIKTDGTLWSWGYGSFGVLGNASTVNVSTPVTTFAGGTNWKEVSAGGVLIPLSSIFEPQTSAIKTDGTLWTWGNGSQGRLGNAGITNRSTPVTTFAGGNNWKQVSTGSYNTSAVKTDGTLWTWGRGQFSALGNGTTILSSTPVTTFAGGTNWKQVSAAIFIAALKTDGTLWTWGSGAGGRLGTNSTADRSTPVTTFAGGTNWKQLDCGAATASAIKTDGTLWIWGSGTYGRLGNNSTSDRSTPVTTFAGGTNWKEVSAGFITTAALTAGTSANVPFS